MKQYTLLTANGINKILKTASDGSKIILKEIVVSDFEGELSEQTTSIPNEKYRGAINAVTIDENDNNILDVDAVIPPEVGGFYIKTAGIYCDDGSLFAVARLADTYKPLLAEGSSKDITLNFKLQIANANKSIVLKVDNNVVLATRKWCENSFLKKTDKLDAYTKQESDERYAQKSDITDGLKVGSYLLWSSQSVTPAGFLVCDGRSLKKSEYAELFAVIGYTYGGSGENFQIPKFDDGRFMRSVGGSADALGKKQKGTLNVMDLKDDVVWGLSTTSRVSNIGDLGLDENEGDFDSRLNTNYVGRLGTYSANVVEKQYPNDLQFGLMRPTNSSVVVLIKAKDVKEATASEVDKTPYATEAKAGIVKLKNSITGNSEDTAITEKAVKDAFACVKSENGYTKLPNGMIFQWGPYPTIAAGQSKDVNLPVAFPTAGVFCSANDSSDAANMAVMLCKFKSNAQITITNDNSVTTGSRNVSGQWFAVGY